MTGQNMLLKNGILGAIVGDIKSFQ